MTRIATPITLPTGYAEWCVGKNGFAHVIHAESGTVIRCVKVCEPHYDPRYQEELAREGEVQR